MQECLRREGRYQNKCLAVKKRESMKKVYTASGGGTEGK